MKNEFASSQNIFLLLEKKRKNKRNDYLVFMQGILNRQNLIG